MIPAARPVALITGAAQRIGAVLANQLHQAGFRVVVHYNHSEAAATESVAAFNKLRANSAVALSADLCSPSAVSFLLDATVAQWGRLDVIVNNASIFSRQDLDWERMWRCNVQAPYQLSHAAFPYLEATQGSIINITDVHAHTPLRGYAAYCQTKAALAMQTRALSQEFAPSVRVNAIAPGAIMWPEGVNQLDSTIQEKIITKTLLKRHGTPENIAQAMMYLVNNTYVTGQSLQVDGGRHL
ncbi:MAG: pteridine reductase [Legionellales bacterium]|nr:pteridine reductase [Legionellales bacterium]